VEVAELSEAYPDAIAWARRKGDGIICIAGSVYLAGEFLQQFR
jgi:hypothetical protein